MRVDDEEKKAAMLMVGLLRTKIGWHQIRRHLNGLSHPILDNSYNRWNWESFSMLTKQRDWIRIRIILYIQVIIIWLLNKKFIFLKKELDKSNLASIVILCSELRKKTWHQFPVPIISNIWMMTWSFRPLLSIEGKMLTPISITPFLKHWLMKMTTKLFKDDLQLLKE